MKKLFFLIAILSFTSAFAIDSELKHSAVQKIRKYAKSWNDDLYGKVDVDSSSANYDFTIQTFERDSVTNEVWVEFYVEFPCYVSEVDDDEAYFLGTCHMNGFGIDETEWLLEIDETKGGCSCEYY